MVVFMGPAYWGCPECGNSGLWVLCDGGFMCSDWPDCGAYFATLDEWIAGRQSTIRKEGM